MLPLAKRQREILDYLNEFIQQHGYAPSLEEIGRASASLRSPRSTNTSPTFKRRASSNGPGTEAGRWRWCRREPADAPSNYRSRVCGRWRPDRGGRLERDHRRVRRISRASETPTSSAFAATR